MLRRPEAASNHSLATVAPSGGAGENGAATPVTAATTTHYTIITTKQKRLEVGYLCVEARLGPGK